MLDTDETDWWWLLRKRLEDATTNKHRFDGLRTARHTLAMCWGREQKGIIILNIHVLRAASRYYHVDDAWLWHFMQQIFLKTLMCLVLISMSVIIIMKIIKDLSSNCDQLDQSRSIKEQYGCKHYDHVHKIWKSLRHQMTHCNDLSQTLHRELSQCRWTHNLGPGREVSKRLFSQN